MYIKMIHQNKCMRIYLPNTKVGGFGILLFYVNGYMLNIFFVLSLYFYSFFCLHKKIKNTVVINVSGN